MQTFDAIVIGSGQAGNPLSFRLADEGWTVALIEREQLGGSCVNYGCTPTKTMLASAEIAHQARRGAELGVRIGGVEVDLPQVVERKNRIVAQWRDGLRKQIDSRPRITLIRETARFLESHVVAAGRERLRAEHIFVNTGTRARVVPIEGIDKVPYLTNHTIMDLTTLPEHLLVVGAGPIGLEFGQMFRRFGSAVTILETADQILSGEDTEVAQSLQEALEREGIAFLLGARATRVAGREGSVRLTVQQGDGPEQDLDASHLLLAAGRQPNTDDLDLDGAGIAHRDGWITVTERLETSVPGVYALGDVSGGPAFTHISYNDFQIVFHNLFHQEKLTTTVRVVPYAVFTDPELGRVGLTERQGRKASRKLLVGSVPASRVARAIERGTTAGLLKVVIDAQSERILGAALLAHAGGELVQTLMTLMLADAPWTTLRQAVYIHPTMTEGFFALMDSVKAPDAK